MYLKTEHLHTDIRNKVKIKKAMLKRPLGQKTASCVCPNYTLYLQIYKYDKAQPRNLLNIEKDRVSLTHT
jgi:hypothetical protein